MSDYLAYAHCEDCSRNAAAPARRFGNHITPVRKGYVEGAVSVVDMALKRLDKDPVSLFSTTSRKPQWYSKSA